jgi:hypothetical protein
LHPGTGEAWADGSSGRSFQRFTSTELPCRHELAGAICGCAARSLALFGGRSSASENICAADQDTGIDPERPSQKAKNDDRAKSKPAGPAGKAARKAASSPDVFNVLAPSEIFPAHGCLMVLETFIRLARRRRHPSIRTARIEFPVQGTKACLLLVQGGRDHRTQSDRCAGGQSQPVPIKSDGPRKSGTLASQLRYWVLQRRPRDDC